MTSPGLEEATRLELRALRHDAPAHLRLEHDTLGRYDRTHGDDRDRLAGSPGLHDLDERRDRLYLFPLRSGTVGNEPPCSKNTHGDDDERQRPPENLLPFIDMARPSGRRTKQSQACVRLPKRGIASLSSQYPSVADKTDNSVA